MGLCHLVGGWVGVTCGWVCVFGVCLGGWVACGCVCGGGVVACDWMCL